MEIKANQITHHEWKFVAKNDYHHDIQQAYRSTKLNIRGDVIVFFKQNNATNNIAIKAFLYIADDEKQVGRLEFLGEFTWNSHIMDFDLDNVSHIIMSMINDYLVARCIGEMLDHAYLEDHDINCESVDTLYQRYIDESDDKP